MTDNILVRIQAPCGTKRIETKSSDTTKIFFDKVQDVFDLSNTGWSIYKDRNKTGEIYTSRSKTMSTYHIRHGDMLYLMLTGRGGECKNKDERRESESSIGGGGGGASLVVEDEVDIFLSKQDGRRHRPRDDKLCRHGALAKCIHCVPVEPYDETYLKNHSPPIKYMSFHAYLRKLTGGVDKGKFAALENISCKIKPGCKEHPPWPGGICTKCQPSAVTLNRQVYRHVDNIMFENPHLVERFLNYWRTSGYQRLGFLYGHYEHYKEVPLGIKATVQAIYEPPQQNSADSIELLPDDLSELIDEIARKLGLLKIGWIFTDLVADDIRKGTVKNLRNMDTYYLSAEECIMSGAFQIQHPNPCKLSPDGFFGSKFVTVVVTGDAQNQVHFEGYQVSNQCMALVRDDCLVPTKDAPELGFVKESSNEQYVPDVFYKDKDEYGNEVTQLARPLPVEYLITDIPTTTPVEPQFTFFSNGTIKPFCVLNRANIGEFQDFQALTSYMQNFPPDQFLEAMSDFHLLIYLATMDTLPLKEHMDDLLEAVRMKNRDLSHHWSKSEQWATIDQLMAAQGSSPPPSRQVSYVGSTSASATNLVPGAGPPWTCRHCTFINQFDRSVCDMCSLPK